MTPKLATARLVLVPYRASLVTNQHVAWLNDPEVVRYSEQRHKKHTLESQHSYLNEFYGDSHIWLIQCGEHDIGTITAYIDRPNQNANMGIMIGNRKFQGRGLGLEAWERVMSYLEHVEHVAQIECGTMAINTAMVKLALKSKMEASGFRTCPYLVNGLPVAAIYFDKILR